MISYRRVKSLCLVIVVLACFLPDTAMAYIGPGAGLSAIGAFLAIVAAVIVAVFGFLWYPIKRLIKKLKGSDSNADDKTPE